jgi:predicted ATPase/DNA-binding SARP family transcriptional activator/DNA-binding CsgD family transcriptional regulator
MPRYHRSAAEWPVSKPQEAGREPEVVRISLLGGFRVSVGSRSVGEGEWRLKKAASLVKLLALAEGHWMHRERAMELLWPGFNPKAAANNLHQALHFARHTLEPQGTSSYLLRLRDGLLELCPNSALWVDVEAFEEAAASARRSRDPATYRTAVELYTGDLLPDDPYEDWVEERREGLRLSYLSLLAEMARLYEERGDVRAAAEAFREAVATEPTHEEAHRGLMRLYARTRQRQQALRQYERLGQALGRELGAEPDAESRRLHEEILAGRTPRVAVEPPPAGPPPAEPPEEAADRHNNLPHALTSFVGREREAAEVKRLLATSRLLTLTGTGGSGKTRLALEVARDLVGAYQDGAWLIEIAPLSEGELVPQAVTGALGVRDQPGRPLTETLVDALREKQALLVMDNCEHLVEACAGLAETLLGRCPYLRILTTSREVLGAAGEVSWQVPSLSGPDSRYTPTVEELEGYESVRLFVERARYRDPSFVLTLQNAQAVAEICERLEGIPLAIELAAARVELGVERIASRLDDSLKLLTAGRRTATLRQRTLRGTLDWSYDLLDEPERKLFGWLSVFAGGWTLEAAEAVGAGGGIDEGDVLDLLSRLVDKSLMVAGASGDGGVRYRLLEPVRQYARERLEESSEAEAVRRRHAECHLRLAEEAEPKLRGAEYGVWLERLEREHDNLRAALGWALGRGEAELGLRLGGALGEFWQMRGYLNEARRWLEAVLANGYAPTLTRARVLVRTGDVAWEQVDYERAVALSEEALALSRELGDRVGVASALYNLGTVALFGNELERASPLLEEAAILQRELRDKPSLVLTLQSLGLVAVAQHDYEGAQALYEEILPLSRQTGYNLGIMVSLGLGALAALGRGDHGRTRERLKEGLELARRMGHRHAAAFHLHLAAILAGVQADPARSVRLWGAAEALYEAIGTTLSPMQLHVYGPYIEAARAQLDEATWQAAWAQGRAMTPEEALEHALGEQEATAAPEEPASTAGAADALTQREREVVMLVARGLTNRQVSSELSISERTVHGHVRKILKKLELRSRAQLAAWVAERRPYDAAGRG